MDLIFGIVTFGLVVGSNGYGGQQETIEDLFHGNHPGGQSFQNSDDAFDPQKVDFDPGQQHQDFDFGQQHQGFDFGQEHQNFGQDDGQKWESFDFGNGKDKEKYESFDLGNNNKKTTIPDRIFFDKGDFVPSKPKKCKTKPVAPNKAELYCSRSGKDCTITCLDGYLFPHGSKTIKLECRDGKWISNHTNWSSEECEPACTPQCLNGGKCLEFNTCECPLGFKGPQCQFDIKTCSKNKLKFNGNVDCTEKGEKLSCKIHCPHGSHVESPAADEYVCYYSIGKFLPDSPPKCVLDEVTTILPTEKQTKTPTSGYCSTWQGSHYKTFDGLIYSFDSNCSYVLIKDDEDVFRIVVTTAICTSCHGEIRIFYKGKEYYLTTEGVPILQVKENGKRMPVPQLQGGLLLKPKGNFVLLDLLANDVTLQWDGKDFLTVFVKETLWNRVSGLCGTLNGISHDDFNTKEGQPAGNIENFVDSWRSQNLLDENDSFCSLSVQTKNLCGEESLESSNCQIILNDPHFTECRKLVNASGFYEACLWDKCKCDSCSCSSISVFIDECKKLGRDPLSDWRKVFNCPLNCDGGKVYKSCGSSERPTCGSIEKSDVSTEENCQEGCFCPEGKVLHNDTCISKESCPCQWKNGTFNSGEKIRKECNTCTCQNGQWVCTELNCGKRCTAVGDPHYSTFDGKRYSFMGHCSYYLVKSENYSIEAENIPCPGFVTNAVNPFHVDPSAPSCTKTIVVRCNGDVIKLKQNKEIAVNGEDILSLPVKKNGVVIQLASSLFVMVTLPNRIQVWWDGKSTAYIDAPGDLEGSTKGLCGTFNGNQKDDFLTPEGDIEKSPVAFANKWKTEESCENVPVITEVVDLHPCDLNSENKAIAEKYCRYLKEDVFSNCHLYVDVQSFYENCLFDVCSCRGKPSDCFCSIFADYGSECAKEGKTIYWREHIKECGIHCQGGQIYQLCGDSCSRSCKDISLSEDFRPKECVEGCNCPDGYTLNDSGECILISQCPCFYHNNKYNPREKVVMDNVKGLEICTCTNAKWTCQASNGEEVQSFNETIHIKEKCEKMENQMFSLCEPEIPVTCKNMHNPPQYSPKICTPGCVCKKGYVWDSVEKICVQANKCPCHHGGVSYSDGKIIQEDCNTCVCRNGKWDCSNDDCPAVCSAWGDSHFKTFDGKIYDFQGSCDFLLASGTVSPYEAFNIIIQIVPCGSTGISCPKSITLEVGPKEHHEKIVLQNSMASAENLTRIFVRESDLFVFVDVFDLGIMIQWDRKTRIYVKVEPKWKGKLKGLCGNFNGDELDDFKTPSSGETNEISANLFVDSWNLQSYCPKSTEIIDTCSAELHRKPWAIEKCGILKSHVFQPCHSEIPVESYYSRCVLDACGCDQGGDCECLCSAIAAYAHECSFKGISINWRGKNICPVQCDNPIAHYNSCVSTCPPKTCENLYKHSKLLQFCSKETCVEGCQPNQCPDDHVFSDSSLTTCIPLSSCKKISICLIENGKVYYEGDRMEDDNCQSCYCSHHEKICLGEICRTTTAVPIIIPTTTVPSLCPPGEVWDDCIVRCNHICHSYRLHAIKIYNCSSENNCVKGCRKNDLDCPKGKFLRDENSCVAEKDCPCMSETGLFIKPGFFYSETECRSCQCVFNSYECANTCTEPPSPATTKLIVPTIPAVYTTIATVTLPPCLNGQYESLINNNTVFSSGEDVLAPVPGLTQKLTDVWISDSEDANQFFQVDLGRAELIFGVSAAGDPSGKHVTRYQLLYSLNGKSFSYVLGDESASEVFIGPPNGFEFTKQILPSPIEARYIRFNPLSWHDGIAMKVDVLGCRELEIQHPTEITKLPTCSDVIGIGSGYLPLSHVSVSSVKSDRDVRFISLSSEKCWQPLSNSQSEWVLLDFGQKRIISGVVTKGFEDSWIDRFKMEYSSDGMSWNRIVGDFGDEKIFTGNYNGQDIKYNYFKVSIRARYLKLIPIKWHNNIGLKLDVIACDNVEPIATHAPPPHMHATNCNVCDGVGYSSFDGSCLCEEDKFWDGEHCVPHAFCPCIVDYDSYAVGTNFNGEDCQECICRFYGISSCTPKLCPDCPHGQQKVFTAQCGCICKPCPENSRLCPSSNTCLDKKYWCDKIQDCPDDELNCTVPATTITEITTECKSFCAPGYVMIPKQVKGPIEVDSDNEINSKTWAKGHKKNKKPEKFECPPFDCVPVLTDETCEVPKCPPDHKIVRQGESKGLRSKCPLYTCVPYPVTASCNITYDSVSTFDGIKFNYEICDHVLSKDLSKHPKWEIKAIKICKDLSPCVNSVDIKHQNQHILLYPESKFITMNQFRYSFDQIILASHADFSLNLIGDSYVFTSKTYKFEVVFDKNFNIKITLPQEMKGKAYGLCGLYDGFIEDDRTLPDGNQAKTNVEFAGGWMNPNAKECEKRNCPQKIQELALEFCSVIKVEPFNLCGNNINLERAVAHCIQSICDCKLSNKTTEECRCSALSNFASSCKKKELLGWRLTHNCPSECPNHLVYHDCYPYACEPTCKNNQCLQSTESCFSGCFCPDGLFRKGDHCIKPQECRDCSCDGYGNSQYVTFDRKNFTFNGNCTYVATRDITPSGVPNFQVLITNHLCDGKKSICTKKIDVYVRGHSVNLVSLSDNLEPKSVGVYVDGALISQHRLPFFDEWVIIEEIPGTASVYLKLPSYHLELRYFYKRFAFTINLPSQYYKNKVEGFCGNCNKNENDDFEDSERYMSEWSINSGQYECKVPEEKPCLETLEADSLCSVLNDVDIFGKCHPVIDPAPFLRLCAYQLCNNETICDSFDAYAQACRDVGICIAWRNRNICPYSCGIGTEYRPCELSCTATCDNYLTLNETCNQPLIEGCFCPENQILINDTCVSTVTCTSCDDKGHHHGDTWQEDKCTTCTCVEKTKTCTKVPCPSTSTIVCEKDEVSKIELLESECCPKERCVCKPREECEEIPIITEELLPGMHRIVNESGCCPHLEITCRPESCPEPKSCRKHHIQKFINTTECCPDYICVKPDNVCLYEYEFDTHLNHEGPEKLMIGDRWMDGPCKSCICTSIDGFAESVCSITNCMTLEQHPDHHDYVLENVRPPNHCCPDFARTGCKDGSKTFDVGDTWIPEETDLCKTVKCANNSEGVVEKVIHSTICKTKCDIGQDYVKSENSCCGRCVQTGCVLNGIFYKGGQIWYSEDNCTTYSCKVVLNTFIVLTYQETCPSLSNCPLENIYEDKCCKRCNLTMESQGDCSLVELPESKTISLIKDVDYHHGKCINIEPIPHFTECSGFCESKSSFQSDTWSYENSCRCCQIVDYSSRTVPLICEDGFEIFKNVTVAEKCSCQPCNG